MGLMDLVRPLSLARPVLIASRKKPFKHESGGSAIEKVCGDVNLANAANIVNNWMRHLEWVIENAGEDIFE
jgi:hypothetical protein